MAIGAFTFQGTNTYKLGITHNPGAEVTPGTEMGRDDAVYHCVVTGDGGTATHESVFLTFVSAYAQTPAGIGGRHRLGAARRRPDPDRYGIRERRRHPELPVEPKHLEKRRGIRTASRCDRACLFRDGSVSFRPVLLFCTVTNTREDGATADAAVIFAVIVLKDETEEPYVFPFADVSVGFMVLFSTYSSPHREG
jgi:hypothetical protein